MSDILERLVETAKENQINTYTISVWDEEGLQTRRLIPANPCQNAYSVAKLFAVTAFGMLVDDGLVTPAATVGEVFADEIKEYGIDSAKWAEVTFHDVMLHKAGFDKGYLDIDVEDATKYPSQDYLRLVLERDLPHAPGTHYQYTDAVFYLVSRAVAKISGIKCDQLLLDRLFSKIDCREVAFSKCPAGHFMGATGLYLRTADMCKLGKIYLDGGVYGEHRIISKEWVDTVIREGYELRPAGRGYAKGGMRGQKLYVNFDEKLVVAWHSFDDGKTGLLSGLL